MGIMGWKMLGVFLEENTKDYVFHHIPSCQYCVKNNVSVPCAQCAYTSVRVQCLDQGLEPLHNWAQREKTIQREWSHNWAVTIGRLTGNWNSETLHAGFWMDGEICFSLFFQFWGVVPLGVTIPSLDGFEDQEQVRYGAAVLVSWIQRLWIT